MWTYDASDDHRNDNGNFPFAKDDDHQDSTTSSSIGNNSDASDDDAAAAAEVQSSFKASFNDLSDLEDALALKKGISTFYSGKSKSYTSLADAVSVPSIQDIVKPEGAYNRKRKNMLAHSVILNKNRNFTSGSGISKKVVNTNRGPLVDGLNNKHHNNAGGESSPPGGSLPPLPARHRISHINESFNPSPRNHCSPWRSFSLSDLQNAAAGGGASSSFTSNGRDEDD